MEVKQALRDHRFRDSLPIELKEDVAKYLQNPGCACNLPFYKKLLKEAGNKLMEYYPGRKVMTEPELLVPENNWMVINTTVDKLAQELQKLPMGRKQIAMARYEDQVTVIIDQVDFF